MRYTTKQLALAIATLLFATVPHTSESAPPHTGIQGNALLYPGPIWFSTQLVIPPVIFPPIIRLFPVATSFTVLSAVSNREVTHVATDTNGAFMVSLPPGRYILVPDLLPASASCRDAAPIEVTVRAREFTSVAIVYACQWPIIVFGMP